MNNLLSLRERLWDEETEALAKRFPSTGLNLRTVATIRAERVALDTAINLLRLGANEGWTEDERDLAAQLVKEA